jgi:hypothetical protein
MNRRRFTAEAALILLGGAAITISGCGGGSSSNPVASTPLTDILGTIDTNHGHSVLITAAQLMEGGAVELDIRGTSGHTHKVSLEAAEVVSVRKGQRVQKDSSGNSHTHVVTFNG